MIRIMRKKIYLISVIIIVAVISNITFKINKFIIEKKNYNNFVSYVNSNCYMSYGKFTLLNEEVNGDYENGEPNADDYEYTDDAEKTEEEITKEEYEKTEIEDGIYSPNESEYNESEYNEDGNQNNYDLNYEEESEDYEKQDENYEEENDKITNPKTGSLLMWTDIAILIISFILIIMCTKNE